MKNLFFDLPIGLRFNGEVHKNVELLKTNGVAEKIFTKKIQDKPFTWQGNVVAAAVKSIGTVQIGGEVRRKYLEEGAVTLPVAVLKLPLAEINTLIVEIHRRVWMHFIPKQEIICKYCGKKLIADIDLDKIDYFPEAKERIKELEAIDEYETINVDLIDGFEAPALGKLTEKSEWAGIAGTVYNRMVFRVPTLEDAIRQETYYSDTIGFWRRIAMDCLVAIQIVRDGKVVDELPAEFHTWYGLKIFNEYLMNDDLRKVRTALVEYMPTLPFAYYEACGCDEQREIPMVMEASNFFSA